MDSWTIDIPLPTWALNEERSMHWAVHSARTKAMREASFVLALEARVPRLDRVSIYAWPVGSTVRQDVGGCFPAVKAAIDGLVDARILPRDTKNHVVRLTLLPPLVGKHRGLRLRIVDESEDG